MPGGVGKVFRRLVVPYVGWGVSGWLSILSGSASREGMEGVAGWAGRERRGGGVRRPLKVPLERRGLGKNCVCSVVRVHVDRIAGHKI